MDELAKLLELLDREGVTELVVGTGRPVSVRRHGQYVAVGREEVTKAQLGALLIGTPFEALIPASDGVSKRTELVIAGRTVAVALTRRGRDLSVRVEPVVAAAPAGFDIDFATERPKKKPTKQPASVPAASSAATSRAAANAMVAAMPTTPGIEELSMDEIETFELADVPQRRAHAADRSDAVSGEALRARTATNSIAPATVKPVKFKAGVAVPRAPNPFASTPVPGRTVSTFDIDLDANADDDLAAYVLDSEPPSSMSTLGKPAAKSPALAPRGVSEASAALPAAPARKSSLADALPPEPKPRAATNRSGLDAAEFSLDDVMPTRGTRARTEVGHGSGDEGVAIGGLLDIAPRAHAESPVVAAPVELPPIATTALKPGTVTLIDEPADATTILPIIKAARARGATDVHIASNRPTMIRTVGELVPLDPKVLSPDEAGKLLLPLLGPKRRDLLATRGYVDLAIDLPNNGGRLRGNISRMQGGTKGSFRIAFPHPPTLEELHLPAELAKVVDHHQGLVVFAGPSGHGKTTTLAALVDLINRTRPHHVLAIEDPVEIEHPRKKAVVSQREVGRHTTSFAAALKASLREDPDVIVIGELRDRETVEIALTAAETGHLVMATMSTPSAAKTIDRLIDMFPPDDQSQVRASLAGALRAIVAQRLLPRADGKGVVPAIEILTGVLPLASLIRENRLFQLPNLMQRGRAFGMVRLDDSLLELARSGTVDQDLAIRNAENKKEFTVQLRGPAVPATPEPAAKKGLGGLFKRDPSDR